MSSKSWLAVYAWKRRGTSGLAHGTWKDAHGKQIDRERRKARPTNRKQNPGSGCKPEGARSARSVGRSRRVDDGNVTHHEPGRMEHMSHKPSHLHLPEEPVVMPNETVSTRRFHVQIRNAMQQRSRWCKGHFQTFFSQHCPLLATRLGLFSRIMYSASVINYASAAVTTPFFIAIPIVSILSGGARM
jgi:hypothetical protein